jgi:hypothetical protein
METLVIYDDNGTIYSSPITGGYIEPTGALHYLEIEIPEGKRLKSVDVSVTPNVPVYEDIPLSETQLLQQQVDSLNIAIANILGV